MQKVLNRAGSAFKVPTDKVSFKKLSKRQKFLYLIAVISGLGLLGTVTICAVVIFVFTAFSSILPSPSRLTNRSVDQSTKIYDRNGELLYSVYGDQNRTLVKLNEVSPYIINATLAAEDGDFYYHEGIDPFGIMRSVYVTLSGGGKQGGSTLTQQVAKLALLTSDRTLTRKVKDVVLALQIENSYTKDEIIQMYLNEIPYGGTTYGIEAAAKTYFGKSSSNLSLAEAALLAGLPQRPTYYNPYQNPEAAKNRQLYVLKLMKDNGWYDKNRVRQHISQEEYDLATKEELKFVKNTGIINAPHFVMYVLNLLNEKYGDDIVQKSGFSVKTSLDLGLQKEFEKIAQEEVAKAKTLDLSNAALVAIDPKTRGVLAMVGSIDYNSNEIDGKFNVATGYRQPGSTLKPITYLTALNQGYTASSVFYDVSTEFKVDGSTPIYEPKNYGGWGFRGPIQMRYALANSVNVTAVKTLDLVGIQNMVDTANSLGLNFKYDSRKHGLAITLGGGEVRLLDLANTYASLAAGGKYKDVNPILEIKSPDGQLIEKVIENEGTQVVDSRNVWIITDILSDNNARAMAFGTGSQLAFKGNKVAVKTGTSNDLKDNWTVGFTPDIAIGVWVGNNDGEKMNSRLASGLTGAAPIWHRSMQYYLDDHPNTEFKKPEDVIEQYVGTVSGMQANEDVEENRREYFIKGTEPKAKSDIFVRVKICKDGEVRDRTYTSYKAERPEWQEAVDNWVKSKYKDDDSELYKHLDPKYDEERDPDKFDIDNCEG